MWRHGATHCMDRSDIYFANGPWLVSAKVQQGTRSHNKCPGPKVQLSDPNGSLTQSEAIRALHTEDRAGYLLKPLLVKVAECQMTSKCSSCIVESWLIKYKWITFIEEKYWYMKTDPRRSSPLSGPNLCHFLFIPLSNILKIHGLFSVCCIFKNPHSLRFLFCFYFVVLAIAIFSPAFAHFINFGEDLRGKLYLLLMSYMSLGLK